MGLKEFLFLTAGSLAIAVSWRDLLTESDRFAALQEWTCHGICY